mmetsp:Transcript_16757/g.48111  ORF Transcript_16757/g.48111 Transcript_16757/m.48111 type:complete len:212 (+) Transcript_16757:59-694(+)
MLAGTGVGSGSLWKLALLVGLLIVDAVVACISDYDFGASSSGSLGFFAVALLNQFAVAATIYSLLCKTWPFQIGLVGVVTSRFHRLFLVALLYFLLTIFASGLRVMSMRTIDEEDADANALLSQPFFVTMSSLSKLLAPFYYSMTTRAAYELCFPVYYDEEAWQKILERPLLQERVRSARLAKEANRGGHKKKYLDEQEGDDSISSSSGGA